MATFPSTTAPTTQQLLNVEPSTLIVISFPSQSTPTRCSPVSPATEDFSYTAMEVDTPSSSSSSAVQSAFRPYPAQSPPRYSPSQELKTEMEIDVVALDEEKPLVLVTGATGFLGSHCVRRLLLAGYRVRGTTRSLQATSKVDALKSLDSERRLQLVEAELTKAETWPEALRGCTFVLHVASPFTLDADATTIHVAVEGTMNVLKAASKTDAVKKVVLTSSAASIYDGITEDREFTEEDWAEPDNALSDYSRSKILSEKAAWQFHASLPDEKRFALTVINPALMIGPLLITEEGTSANMVRKLMEHCYPVVSPMQYTFVDVRDVAEAHLRAIQRPETDGQRILVSSVPALFFKDLSKALAAEFNNQGYCFHSICTPKPVMWVASHFNKKTAQLLPLVGRTIRVSNEKAKRLLNLTFRDPRKSVVEMAYSLIERGLAKKSSKYKGVPANIELT